MTEPLTLAQRCETPERIWADRDAETNEKQWFSIEGMGIEYVRADIAEHMRTELSNRTMAYGVIHSEWKQEKAAREAAEAKLVKVEAERDELSVKHSGAVERALNILTAKNHWHDKFRDAEAELAQANKCIEALNICIKQDDEREAGLSAELAEARKLLRPFARIAEIEDSIGTTFQDPDGQFTHMPKWVKADLWLAWQTARSLSPTQPEAKEAHTDAWPNGCHSPSSCVRHMACMYTNCRHENRSIKAEIEAAIKAKEARDAS